MKKALIVFGVLGVLAVGWFFGLPAYRVHKEKKFAAQAHAHLAKGEYRAALLSAQQTLVLNGTNLAACAVMAELADAGRSPNAIIWRRRIAEFAPTISNQVVLAAGSLHYEQPPFPIAQQALTAAATIGSVDQNVPYQVVSAQLALKQGRIADAEKFFENAIRLEPTNRLHRLNLATVRLESRDAAVSTTAHAELEAMQMDAQVGEHALRSLTAHHAGRKDFESALKFSKTLLEIKSASFDDRLDRLNLLHEAKRTEFDGYAALLKQSSSTNAVLVFAVTSRLLACGQAEQTLAWLKSLPQEMQTEQPVPLAFADTLSRLKDWRGMEERLNAESWKDQDFMRMALMAYAVRNQKDDAVANAHWAKAVQLASERPERLGLLSQLASGWRWDSEAEGVLWRVARDFPRERWALDALHNGYVRTRNTRGLFSIYSTLLDRNRTNAMVMNNYASLALLLSTNMPRAHQLAQQVYLAGTNNYAFRSTYAWSLHLQGKTAEALVLMEQISPAQLADPAVASYYGAMLVASGQKEKARMFLDKTQGAAILPEEKALADEARKSL